MKKLKEKYSQDVIPELIKEFNYSSIMAVPKITKVIVNIGVGDAVSNTKSLDVAVAELQKITGQKPLITKAKKSISSFKLREGMPIGCKTTLRGNKMYDFLDKLFNINLPRTRDFRGLNRHSFDKEGNYSLGIKEQLIFPEIDYDDITKIRGMSISIIIKNNDQDYKKSLTLLTKLGMPLKKK